MTLTRFWRVRHAPVAVPAGIIHAADAPADISDSAAINGPALYLAKRDAR